MYGLELDDISIGTHPSSASLVNNDNENGQSNGQGKPRKKQSKRKKDNGVNQQSEALKQVNDLWRPNKRKCTHFIRSTKTSTETEDVCGCNYPKKSHSKDAIDSGESLSHDTWDSNSHTAKKPTDAFGEIEFVGYGGKVAKYICVDADTPMKDIMRVLTKTWGMEKPKLLISVTGGAKNFTMKARLRDIFRRGLMKTAISTGAWVMTAGTHAGVMKHVGEAVRDFGLTADNQVMAIGIVPWGCVQNKQCLIDIDQKQLGKWPAEYKIEKDKRNQLVSLDPNHTHFIMVDNGSQHQFGTEIDFRANLEKAIAQMDSDTGKVKVPVCLVVFAGGPGTLKTVHSAIKSNTPTVIIKGSGRVADILAYAYEHSSVEDVPGRTKTGSKKMKTFETRVIPEIKEKLQSSFGSTDLDENARMVMECLDTPNLISVFENTSKVSARDVDLAILKALLKANKDQKMVQLKLALALNRIDLATSEIFTDDSTWEPNELNEVMMLAIQQNRADFVELFLDHGVNLKDVFTTEGLERLFKEIPKTSLLHNLLQKNKKRKKTEGKSSNAHRLEDIGHLIHTLLGDSFKLPSWMNPKEDDATENAGGVVERPRLQSQSGTQADESKEESFHVQGPFIWAVLMNYQSLAKIFWKEGKEATAAALFASSICRSMKMRTSDEETKVKLEETENDFDKLAVGVVKECYKKNQNKTYQILVRKMANWGGTSSIILAARNKNKKFISQTACKSLLSSIWWGKMSQDNNVIKIFIVTLFFVFPFLIPLWIKFDDEKDDGEEADIKRARYLTQKSQSVESVRSQAEQQDEQKETSASCRSKITSWLNKIKLYYKAPIVSYTIHLQWYLIFLMLYAHVIVVRLSTEFYWQEALIFAWVFTLLAEEIRQFQTSSVSVQGGICGKIKAYFRDYWNFLDCLAICVFFVGSGLFVFGDGTCLEIARVFFSINFMMYSFRILHILYLSKILGPKIVMIWEMMYDLAVFVVVLFLFIFMYAIASEAVMHPNQELTWKLLFYLPRKAYWSLYGELMLEDIEGTGSCTDNSTLYSGYSQTRCSSEVGQYYVPILMACYILLTNILLLNLLIAMFSYTFNKIQENTELHWAFLRFNMVYEFTQLPCFPSPFSIIFNTINFFRWMVSSSSCCQGDTQSCCCGRQFCMSGKDKFCEDLEIKEEMELIQWENVIADPFYLKLEASQNKDGELGMDNEESSTSSSDGNMLKRMENLEKHFENVERRFDNVEKQNQEILRLLKADPGDPRRSGGYSSSRSTLDSDIEESRC